MSRDLTSAASAALTASNVKLALLFQADFDSGTTRAWTGLGDLSWNSQTWYGTGNYLTIGGIEETNEIKATGTTVTLSGIPSELVSIALSEDYQGRAMTIWLALFDSSNAIISDPIQVLSGRMDIMEIQEGGETATISVSVENRLIDLERPRVRRYTNEDQKIDYPNDKGFEFVPSIQEKQIIWGP